MNDNELKVGLEVIHYTSGTIYRIKKILPASVTIERISDRQLLVVSISRFKEIYKPLTTSERQKLSRLESLKIDKVVRKPAPDLRAKQIGAGLLIPYNPSVSKDILVLDKDIAEEINIAIKLLLKRKTFNEFWQLDDFPDYKDSNQKCILNFYGPSGTGKTLAVKYLSARVKKPIYQVKYSEVGSQWLHATSKGITSVFDVARETKSILLLDEADTLLSKRTRLSGDNTAAHLNEERNVLMQELDRFNGIMVTTTNFFNNYDPAIIRRIARHIQFKLPNREQIVLLFDRHLPNKNKMSDIDLEAMSVLAEGLSGGDIRNICLNSMERASTDPDPEKWVLKESYIIDEINSAKEAKLNSNLSTTRNAR